MGSTGELLLTSVLRPAPVYPIAIALAASDQVPLDVLVDAQFDLSQVVDALSVTSKNRKVVKSVVHP